MRDRRRIRTDPLGKAADSYVGSVLGVPAVEKRSKRSRRRRAGDNPTDHPRRTYYVPNDLHERLSRVADDLDVGISDLHNYLIARSLDACASGEWEIEPSERVVRRVLNHEV